MTDTKEQDTRKTLSLGSRGKLSIGKSGDHGQQVRQSFSHGRSKAVQVEVKRKRTVERGADVSSATRRVNAEGGSVGASLRGGGSQGRQLSKAERESRERALRLAREDEATRPAPPPASEATLSLAPDADLVPEALVEAPPPEPVVEELPPEPETLDPETLRQREMEELRRIEDDERQRAEAAERVRQEDVAKRQAEDKEREQQEEARRREVADRAGRAAAAKVSGTAAPAETEEEAAQARGPRGRPGLRVDTTKRPPARTSRGEPRRRGGKMTVTQALRSEEDGERTRSLASVRRARERARLAAAMQQQEKIVRDVVVPETITVQELANRMAERAGDVVKALMRMGVMATINQTIDADTAELLVNEFGHRMRRVSDADVLIGLTGADDQEDHMLSRPPVVTIMGHVDHGKTSLLDAIRQTNVVSKEAGGITQHIGAYQVVRDDGTRITFIDTPGHAAFTEMRARGANTTDVVILVVAADDGVMPQTAEAINHAKAAGVPIIVAINKSDLPAANPDRVRNELLQYDIVVEEMSGEVQSVEVSAKTGAGLDELLEAISLQAEILELKANPDRPAEAVVVEAKLERGRGAVATVLVQRGTLRVGDIFVTGAEWGRVRAMTDDLGETIESAGPARPVEVLGLTGAPMAGDDFVVVENEQRAREVSEYRSRKQREQEQLATGRGSLEEMFSKIEAGETKTLPVVIKADAHGSVEAIIGSLNKLSADNDEVDVRVLHSGVGGINESDVTLANATGAMIIGFNVRANPQAREMARRDNIEIRYYSVIYDVIDDARDAVLGLMTPKIRENIIGNAEIRQVFNITKVGKVAGCYVTDGNVRRGSGVRLLRDNVVIHTGTLKTLKRFKDEVREVQHGYECGMAFENYDDIRDGDVIEAFELEEVAPQL